MVKKRRIWEISGTTLFVTVNGKRFIYIGSSDFLKQVEVVAATLKDHAFELDDENFQEVV